MPESEHYELEERLKRFLSVELKQLNEKMILDFKNLLLEHDKELAKLMSEQDKSILLLKKDIENLTKEFTEAEKKHNEFKKETREKIGSLMEAEDRAKGALGFGKWIIGGGLIGWIVGIIQLASKFLGS